MTPDEFLNLPLDGCRRELIDGVLQLRPEVSNYISVATSLLYTQLGSQAQLRHCQTFAYQRVRVDNDIYWPDLTIAKWAAHGWCELNPVLIVDFADGEIDPVTRLTAFRRTPSLRSYVWVDCERRRIDVSTQTHASMHITLGQTRGNVRLLGRQLDVGKFFNTVDSIVGVRPDEALMEKQS